MPRSFLFRLSIGIDVQPQALRVQIQLILSTRLLQNGGNIPGVLDLSQVNVASALLDGLANEFSRAGFTLGSDDGCLFLLSGFVDNECSTLSLLLRYLLSFNGGGEFRGKGKMLDGDIRVSIKNNKKKD